MTVQPDDFSGLHALFINCTLKRSPELSNTQGLIDISTNIMEKHGVDEVFRDELNHPGESGDLIV